MNWYHRIIPFLGSLLTAFCLHAQSEFDSKVTQIAQQLAQRLKPDSNKRVAVSNFLDLQGNVTELGKYLAEAFSVELVNTKMKVVDRSRLHDLLTELKMTEEKLVNPANALALGKLAGIEYIITGTTTMLDNSIDLSIKAMDIQQGLIVAAQRGNIPRTEAINQLFRSQVSGNGVPSSVSTMPTAAGSGTVDAVDDVNQVKSMPMKKTICKDWQGNYLGYVCFENQLKSDIVLSFIGPITMTPNTFIPVGGKQCSPLLWVNGPYASDPQAKEYYFNFKTTDPEKPLHGTFQIVVEGCVTKSVMLHPRNLLMSAK